jgi:tetratricopeptide (TPR) repeat protein
MDAPTHRYRNALELDRHSTYAGINILRLLMLTDDISSGMRDQLDRMLHLASYEVTDSRLRSTADQWWRMFDLADVLALMDERDQALETYQQAINQIPEHQRRDCLLSPFRSWQELLTCGGLNQSVSICAERILAMLHEFVKSEG